MAHKEDKKIALRNAFVYERLDLKAAASASGVPYATASRWKKKATEEGDNWILARNAARKASGPAGELSLQILEDFATQYQRIMDDVKADTEMRPGVRADLLTKLGDSYAKIMKIAGGNDNRIAKLSINLEFIKLFSDFVAEKAPQHLETFSLLLEQFKPILSKHYGGY